MVRLPGKVSLAEPEAHPRDLGDVLVSPVESPNFVLSDDKASVSLDHVRNEPLLLLDHEQIGRSPAVRDLLELTGFLPDDPIEEGVVHIRNQVRVNVLEFCSLAVTKTVLPTTGAVVKAPAGIEMAVAETVPPAATIWD